MSHKRYEKIKFIGEGQFATVYKARDKQTDRVVAIKKIKLGNYQEAQDGVNRTALREIKLLRELHHENVIALLDVYGKESSISLVFDIMDFDLEQIIHDRRIWLSFAHIKSYLLMTLKGLEYLHQNFILHRDLKPNNLLLDRRNVLKLADFGLARTFGSPSRIYSHQVVTRWYRSPELLYGARMYGVGIDIWAVGCILAELFAREPLFPGESDLDTLDKICTIMGSPNQQNWPGVSELPDYVKFNDDNPGVPLGERFSAVPQDGLDILESMLRLNPNERCTCTEALKMPYFTTAPYPTPISKLPRFKEEGKSDDEGDADDQREANGGDGLGSDSNGNSMDGPTTRGSRSDQPGSIGSLDVKFDIKLEPNGEAAAAVKPTKAKRLKFE